MSANSELHRQLRSSRARFYLADFHVHSPASADVRSSPRFDDLSSEEQRLLRMVPDALANDPSEYERAVMSAFPPPDFLEALSVRRDNVLSNLSSETYSDWAIVAITDHNVCKYSCELASHAWSKLDQVRLLVLPGIELGLSYPVPPENDLATAHVLCIFAPTTAASDIRLAIASASESSWTFGQELTIQSLDFFVNGLRHHPDYPAICIAAHVGSGAGVQSATRNVILSRLDAAISRVKGELEIGHEPDTEELIDRLRQLEKERKGADEVSLRILNLIGQCGFDALQVRGQEDEVHYRRLHRFRDEFGRAVPIVCSDAHKVEKVFETESGLPHIKLPGLSSRIDSEQLYSAIRHAIRLGETRFSYVTPGSLQYWISGVEIEPDAVKAANFWPFKQKDPQKGTRSFVLPLSRNLNCLIGGRGSGKSAALEALDFVVHPSFFDNFQNVREDELPEFYGRAKATLSGCKLSLCWQFSGHDQAQHLPKRAIFASRYFDVGGRHEVVTYSNADGLELLPEQTPDHGVQYFRLGEIEKQAGPKKLRSLFDQICGIQVQEHETRIRELIAELALQRVEMVKVSQRIADLTREGASLREYAKRKRLLDEVNVPDVRGAYEEIDRVTAAESVANKALSDWSNICEELELDEFAEGTRSFFDGLVASCTDEKGELKPYHELLAEIASSDALEGGEAQKASRQKITEAISELDSEIESVTQELSQSKEGIGSRGKAARDALVAKGLPPGGKDREAKKKAFDEAEEALKQYRNFVTEWDRLNDERKSLVEELHEECNRRSAVRQDTAAHITEQLKRDLDSSVLIIEADAQPQMDNRNFWKWLDTHFTHQTFRYRKQRLASLLSKGLTPDRLRNLLLQEGDTDHTLLQVDRPSADEGAIDETIAKNLLYLCVGRYNLECEVEECSVDPSFWSDLPGEIHEGLITFFVAVKTPMFFKVDDVLQLDEITFDDVPVIRLNDRPKDPLSKPRPVEFLSPGQRCSAILPILLLTGTSPLIIDQPEDNMDNRLIRQVIVNILSSIKLRRQVIIATHNPNLPVLGDVEQAVILQGVGETECQVRATGNLDTRDVVHHLTEVMEGGREAFQYRQTIYQVHWPGAVYAQGDET